MHNNVAGDSGIVVVDKPADMSSAKAVAVVKRLFRARRAGHAGTLDLFATGVLVCCINKATRLAEFFLKSEKTYLAVLTLGVATDTQDATGTETARGDVDAVTDVDVLEVANRFTGTLMQRPPAFSALKHRGTPLYKYARKGRFIRKPPREVHIRRMAVLDVNLPEVHLEVDCSAGTYIRTLCADIGSALGCGGHLKELRRIRSGPFSIDEAFTVDEIDRLARENTPHGCLIGMTEALRDIPGVRVDRRTAEHLRNGRPVFEGDLPDVPGGEKTKWIKVVDGDNRLIAVLAPKKGAKMYDYRCVFN